MAQRELTGLHPQQCVVGIEYQAAVRGKHRGDAELNVGQSGLIIDAVLAEMVGTDVGDHRGVGARYGQAAPQNAAARNF